MVRQLSAGAVRAQHSRSYIVQSRREEKAPGLELTLALRLGGRRLQRLEDSDNLPTMKLHVKAGHEGPGSRVKGPKPRVRVSNWCTQVGDAPSRLRNISTGYFQ